MRKMKKMLAIAMSLAVLATGTMACNKEAAKPTDTAVTPVEQAENTGEAEGGEITLPLSAEKVTLTMYAGAMDGNFAAVANDYNENAFFQELEKRTNVHIEFQTVPMGSTDAFNLMIASGELPDLIYGPGAYQDGMDAAIDDGYYLDMTPYLETHLPNYNKLRTQNEEMKRNSTTDSGRIAAVYQIYQTEQSPWMGLMIRKDWLNELNLEVPTTVSEWETVLTAFKEKKGAYAPMSLGGDLGLYGQGFGISGGTVFSSPWQNVDGKVVFSNTSDNMKAFLTVLADWYKKGLIDPDFMTKQSAFFADTAMVTTGQTGIFNSIYTLPDMFKGASEDKDFEVVAIKNPIPDSGEEGRVGYVIPVIGGAGMAVSADSKNKEIAMKWLDYMYSEEGALLANYGVENDTFTFNEQGKPVFTEKITKNPDGMAMAQAMAFYTLPPSFLACYYDWTRELAGVSESSIHMMDVWKEQKTDYNYPAQATMTNEENREFASLYTSNIQTYAAEKITQFITGVNDINTEWDNYVSTIKDLGIDRCIEIKQAALDRYLAR